MLFFGLEKYFKIIVDSNCVKGLCNDDVMVSMVDIF